MRSATKKRVGKDPDYLAWIKTLPCSVQKCATQWAARCGQMAEKYRAKTEAAHIGDRGLSQKCPDREAIPLCAYHHRLGPFAHHTMGRAFWIFHNSDKAKLIAELNARYEEQEKAS